VITKPFRRLQQTSQELDRLEGRMFRAMQQKLTHCQHETQQMAAKLDAINPLSVLARGYSLTMDKNRELLIDYRSVTVNDTIVTRLSSGELISRVQSIVEPTD
jgi:exodeoxyribonuclease VII large subunit